MFDFKAHGLAPTQDYAAQVARRKDFAIFDTIIDDSGMFPEYARISFDPWDEIESRYIASIIGSWNGVRLRRAKTELEAKIHLRRMVKECYGQDLLDEFPSS